MNYSTNISNTIPGKKYSDFSFDRWPLQGPASHSLPLHLSKPIKSKAAASERCLAPTRQVKTVTTGLLKLSKNRNTNMNFRQKRGRVLRAPEIRFIALVCNVALRIFNYSPSELPLKLAVKPGGVGRGTEMDDTSTLINLSCRADLLEPLVAGLERLVLFLTHLMMFSKNEEWS